jgi:hypothetical protein
MVDVDSERTQLIKMFLGSGEVGGKVESGRLVGAAMRVIEVCSQEEILEYLTEVCNEFFLVFFEIAICLVVEVDSIKNGILLDLSLYQSHVVDPHFVFTSKELSLSSDMEPDHEVSDLLAHWLDYLFIAGCQVV